MTAPTVRRGEIIRALDLYLLPGQTTEIRCPLTRASATFHCVSSGYYRWPEDRDALLRDVSPLDAEGIYFIPSPVLPDLYARAAGRMIQRPSATTTDAQIVTRRWLLVDLDAVRPKGISSTDSQHDAALGRARDVSAALLDAGWPLPIMADSGNGAHLCWRVSLPNDDTTRDLCRRTLEALNRRFGDEIVGVDRATSNAARIWKLPGTWARKGDSLPETPHRMARLIDVPDPFGIVTREQIEELAGPAPAPRQPATRSTGYRPGTAPEFSADTWIADHLPEARGQQDWEGGRRWVLPVCPFEPAHSRGEAWIAQLPSGAMAAGCQHESCTWDWRALRERMEPGCYDRATPAPTAAAAPPLPTDDDAPSTARNTEDRLLDRHTDTAAAARFVRDHGAIVRHVAQLKQWLVWDATRWQTDSTLQVLDMARRDASRWVDTITAANGEDGEIKAARSRESSKAILASLTLASADPSIAWTTGQLDTNPWLLNTPTGTLDLRTGTLRAASQDDAITRRAPTRFDPQATAPRWTEFLREIMDGDEDRVEFLARWVGYCLTGIVSEQAWSLFIGAGSNGKGVLVNTILKVLGKDYAAPAAPGLLLAHRNEQHPTELFDLRGLRMVIANELPKSSAWAEDRLKWLTGADTIKARKMKADFVEFDPTFKFTVCVNDMPRVRDQSIGFWRRVRVIPFPVSFVGREDKTLADRLLAEAPGILSWAVQGCLRWQSQGLPMAPAMARATSDYREQEDQVGRFISWRSEQGYQDEDEAPVLYRAYVAWCQEQGEQHPISSIAFGRDLTKRGWKQDRRHGRKYWKPPGATTGQVLPLWRDETDLGQDVEEG